MVVGKAGNLYGTASQGGIVPCWNDIFIGADTQPFGCGTIFKLDHLTNGTWGFELLHSFCAATLCPDGARPNGLTSDANGSFYATTIFGGANLEGTLFKFSHPAEGSVWPLSVLYSFCMGGQASQCPDGFAPVGSVTINPTGNIFGVVGDNPQKIFEITPSN